MSEALCNAKLILRNSVSMITEIGVQVSTEVRGGWGGGVYIEIRAELTKNAGNQSKCDLLEIKTPSRSAELSPGIPR